MIQIRERIFQSLSLAQALDIVSIISIEVVIGRVVFYVV